MSKNSKKIIEFDVLEVLIEQIDEKSEFIDEEIELLNSEIQKMNTFNDISKKNFREKFFQDFGYYP